MICVDAGNGQATDVDVRITAPSWVARGSSATLRCLHQVPPQLLYKVEFLRTGAKVLQYVRERVPPYTNYTFQGGKVNVPEDAIKYFSYRVSSSTRTKGGGYRHRKHQHRYIAPEFNYTAKYWALIKEKPREAVHPPISLWVSIAELRTPAHGRLQLTCTATIPDEVGPGEKFADVKKQTVTAYQFLDDL
ncbi:unnamed protein product [Leptidea sinapis]|uniref:Uncharacterized protein n=1 Tax=Leptidea sinapis TaxID=189913 RepID=A0A5E4Q2X2_9NEOP|nr:unnamed protein product [Leptidea sinapis]